MQIEISLRAEAGSAYSARDLGFLLHKNPDRVHERSTAAGQAYVFYSQAQDERTTCVLYLDIDPIGLVRGRTAQSDGLLTQYVNDRPYVANSFLSVALARSFGQSMSGKSKERQELADRPLPFEARVTPVAVSGGEALIEAVFAPLGYEVRVTPYIEQEGRGLYDLRLGGEIRLRELLNHIYVLIPVLDNAKHYWVDRDEIDKLLAKGGGWLAQHPEMELITRRALKHRRALANLALARLAEAGEGDEESEEEAKAKDGEEALEKPIRLHDLRLNTVVDALKARGAGSVLDLGCGEGKLLRRLIRDGAFQRILGVDSSMAALSRAAGRLRLEEAGDALRQRVTLQMGSLTYADRRWRDFDAATLVEVIEHVDPPRLSALERSVFGEARPRVIVVTTPNREYNVLFEGMAEDAFRHSDHRFEWTRAEFQAWAQAVAATYGYAVEFQALGPIDETHGGPSQMAVFEHALPSEAET